jgi:hypothetical protein
MGLDAIGFPSARVYAKPSFARKCVPKRKFGHEGRGRE